jgi:hypothetical protein
LRVVRVTLAQQSSVRTSSVGAQKTLSLISASSRDLTSRARVQPKPVPVHASLVNLSLSSASASASANCKNVGEPQHPVQQQQQPLASILSSTLNSTLNSSLNESNAAEHKLSAAPKSESGVAPDESAPTSRSSKSRRRQRQRERQQSKNYQCESVGGPPERCRRRLYGWRSVRLA